MASDGKGSVTHWICDLKAGDHGAVQALWERYLDRLLRLARAKLRALHQSGAVADEEDAALSAFESLYEGAIRGKFPRLGDRDDLWRLLMVITARKVLDQRRRENRKKYGGGRVVHETDCLALDNDGGRASLEQVVGSEPSPEFAAQVAEQFLRLLDALEDQTLRQIALWKLEGYTDEEIRLRLGCVRRTVANKLALIRKIWREERPG